MARPTYKDFVRKTGQPPKREALSIGGDGPYFRDGHMNRDPHGSVDAGPAPTEGARTVRVEHYHFKDRS